MIILCTDIRKEDVIKSNIGAEYGLDCMDSVKGSTHGMILPMKKLYRKNSWQKVHFNVLYGAHPQREYAPRAIC